MCSTCLVYIHKDSVLNLMQNSCAALYTIFIALFVHLLFYWVALFQTVRFVCNEKQKKTKNHVYGRECDRTLSLTRKPFSGILIEQKRKTRRRKTTQQLRIFTNQCEFHECHALALVYTCTHTKLIIFYVSAHVLNDHLCTMYTFSTTL